MYSETQKRKGCFISIEGTDGAGKTTQIKRLHQWVKEHYPNREFVFTREPGGSELAEKIRAMIFDHEMDVFTEAMLFATARVNHLQKTVIPALDRDAVVISDRYVDSSLIYQGLTHGNMPYVMAINGIATTFPTKAQMDAMAGRIITNEDEVADLVRPFLPDLTILMKCPFEVAKERLRQRAGTKALNRLDLMQEEYKRRHSDLLIKHFESLLDDPYSPFSDRDFVVMDASGAEDEVFAALTKEITTYLGG